MNAFVDQLRNDFETEFSRMASPPHMKMLMLDVAQGRKYGTPSENQTH